jgi:dolichol-phosphate mannosyltransferase
MKEIHVTGDRTGRPSISVVVPVFRAESCLRELADRLVAALARLVPDFEVILVDDGSADGS